MKLSEADHSPPAPTEPRELEHGGRDGVLRSLLVAGPATASTLAARLGVSATAVRRHLEHLESDGLVEGHDRAPYGPSPVRGRGRPARVFALTPQGRSQFPTAYDDLALALLEHLDREGGVGAVTAFARHRAAELESTLRRRLEGTDGAQAGDVVAEALSDLGFAATVTPAPGATQLCQHHCPVAHVAERFPQLCEAETEALANALGTHVQRLATIAHGDGVCTTVIPTFGSQRSSA